jgi:hypothetical protein
MERTAVAETSQLDRPWSGVAVAREAASSKGQWDLTTEDTENTELELRDAVDWIRSIDGLSFSGVAIFLEVSLNIRPLEQDDAAAFDVGDDSELLPLLDGANGNTEPECERRFSDESF